MFESWHKVRNVIDLRPYGTWPQVERRKRPRTRDQKRINYWEVPPDGNRNRAYIIARRVIDIVCATILIILFAPIMITTFLVLALTTRGKPIFKQTRVGECGRLFTLYKFRTMRLDADKLKHTVRNEKDGPVFKNRHDPRVTPIGRILRKFSIDELPQLFNVLKGDMTLVGPRPPLESEVRQYEPWQLRRLAVKPGLTCIWQVNGRADVPFTDWVRMDLRYIDNQCLLADVVLLARTPAAVLAGRGAY